MKIYGNNLMDLIQDTKEHIFELDCYLYTSENLIQWCMAECYVTFSKLSLKSSNETLTYFLSSYKSICDEMDLLKETFSKKDEDKNFDLKTGYNSMCRLIVQYEAVTKTIALILERNIKDMNELSSDYLEATFSIVISELKKVSPVDFKTITFNDVGITFDYTRASGAWKLMSSLMKMDQKWASVHMKGFVYCWRDYFESEKFGCNLTSSTGEIYIYTMVVINSLEALKNFI